MSEEPEDPAAGAPAGDWLLSEIRVLPLTGDEGANLTALLVRYLQTVDVQAWTEQDEDIIRALSIVLFRLLDMMGFKSFDEACLYLGAIGPPSPAICKFLKEGFR